MTGVLVLHSTEGSSLIGAVQTLRARNVMSHEVVDIREREIVQLVPLDRPARALLNRPGGVETNNRGGVVQVELVGFASRSTAEAAGRPDGPIMPELTDDELAWLGRYVRDLCARCGIPFTFPLPFLPYPQSYGNNGVRLSFDQWMRVEGVIGHMHVPENDHGDPGALDVARMAALSAPAPAQLRPLVEEEDDDMYFVKDDRPDWAIWQVYRHEASGLLVRRHVTGVEWGVLGPRFEPQLQVLPWTTVEQLAEAPGL